jgi:hypothetical protein
MTPNRTVCIDARVLARVREALMYALDHPVRWHQREPLAGAINALDAAIEQGQSSGGDVERLKMICHWIASTALIEPRREDIAAKAREAFALTDAPAASDGDEHD